MALPKAALLLFSCVLMLIGVTSYEVRTLEPCFLDNVIYLGNNDKSALNFSLGSFKFDRQSLEPVFKCSFHIEAERNEKIIAVIQRMNLRGTDYNCVDFVEFSDVPKLSITKIYERLNNVKKQICGNKNVSNMTLPSDMVLHAFNKYTLPQNVYITNGNDLKVKVVISKMPLRRDETLDFQIIFTSAKVGLECRDRSEFDCGNYTCIWRGFYKDGFVNCPYAGCPDEDGCEGPTVKYSSGSGTTIIICAVVSMLSVLGMFLFCLFICRRCKVLCWANRTPSTRDPGARVHVSSSHPSETVQPSAPPLISLHDKDLPPSYDSLFPARDSETGVSKDDVFKRCGRSRNFSQKLQRVRREGEAVSYSRRKNQNEKRSESASNDLNRDANIRHPYNRPSNRQNRDRYIRNHSSNSREQGSYAGERFNSHKRGKSRSENLREIQNKKGRDHRYSTCSRRRSRSETAVTTRSRKWVRTRRNTDGSR